MATDIARIIENACAFYELSGKTVVSVGAGGGQFVEFGRRARRIIAVDQDAEAMRHLRDRLDSEGLSDKYEMVPSDFSNVAARGDVVLFEFSLHEMPDPLAALQHARTLAPDTVVLDHAPGSEWLYYVVEQEKVHNSTEAMRRFGVRSRAVFQAEQRFRNHDELLAKVAVQGPLAIERIRRFQNAANIVIPMLYVATLL